MKQEQSKVETSSRRLNRGTEKPTEDQKYPKKWSLVQSCTPQCTIWLLSGFVLAL